MNPALAEYALRSAVPLGRPLRPYLSTTTALSLTLAHLAQGEREWPSITVNGRRYDLADHDPRQQTYTFRDFTGLAITVTASQLRQNFHAAAMAILRQGVRAARGGVIAVSEPLPGAIFIREGAVDHWWDDPGAAGERH